MIKILKNLWNKFTNILYPGYGCFVCGRENENPEKYICPRCEKIIVRLEGKLCEKCGAPISGMGKLCLECKNNNNIMFTKAKAVFSYDENISKPVMGLKYNGDKFVLSFMAKEMKRVLDTFDTKIDCMIPVPISAKRLKKRGFNQAELIATELNKLCENKIEVLTDVVVRAKEVIQQVKLTRKERLENLQGAFKLNKKVDIIDKNVLIVDDVFTTGATSNEVARVLTKLKPKNIFVLTFAKTLFTNDNTTK